MLVALIILVSYALGYSVGYLSARNKVNEKV